jgi:triosephosphate isomerase (TIM)
MKSSIVSLIALAYYLQSLPAVVQAFTSSALRPVSRRTEALAATTTRRPFISGNWKLNPQTREEAVQLASDIAQSITPTSPDIDVALFVPYVFIEAAMNSVDEKLMVGAEVRVLFCSG